MRPRLISPTIVKTKGRSGPGHPTAYTASSRTSERTNLHRGALSSGAQNPFNNHILAYWNQILLWAVIKEWVLPGANRQSFLGALIDALTELLMFWQTPGRNPGKEKYPRKRNVRQCLADMQGCGASGAMYSGISAQRARATRGPADVAEVLPGCLLQQPERTRQAATQHFHDCRKTNPISMAGNQDKPFFS